MLVLYVRSSGRGDHRHLAGKQKAPLSGFIFSYIKNATAAFKEKGFNSEHQFIKVQHITKLI